MRHRNYISVCLAVILLGSWVRPSFAQEALTKLLVAHAGLISTHASVWLAEDQGFYKKHGLDVTSVFIGSGSVTSQALVAGEAKVASTSVGPRQALSRGAELVILAGTFISFPINFG
jgi:ABC-type nitrate/sulfonate/bicarbonate transport system substrate-binding protein